MDSVIFNIDPSNANVTAKVWQEKGHSYLNMSAETFVDLEKMVLSFVYAIGKNDNDKNYENIIMQSSLNSCKVNSGNRGNFIIKMVMDQFKQNSDFNFTCPFPKVNITISIMTIIIHN